MLGSTLLLVAVIVHVDAHGSLVIPQTRNSVDRNAPQWKGGYVHAPGSGVIKEATTGIADFPGTGRWGAPNETCGTVPYSCQEGCSCSNGTEPCDVGQACFWFASGCTIGCDKCDGVGSRQPNSCRCDKCAAATVNDPKYRTGNRKAKAGSPEDIYKYNPWRSPGLVPTFDPCGMAGGGPKAGVESGEYNTTNFAQQGDLGSKSLPYTPTGTVWTAGELATTAWFIRANHGGGYIFWLCPRNESLTEECFRQHPLRFEGPQTLKWNDGTTEDINGTYVEEGTNPAGSMWAMNPLPPTPDETFPSPCKTHREPTDAPMAVGQFGQNQDGCSGNWPTTVIIMDKVRVPADTPPGEYVLGWRWDCEQTAQVWQSCADITIAPPRVASLR